MIPALKEGTIMEKSHAITKLSPIKGLSEPNPKQPTANIYPVDIKPDEVVERIKDNPILSNIVLVSLRSEPTPNSVQIEEYGQRFGPEFMVAYNFFRRALDMPSYPDIPLDKETIDQALEDPIPAQVIAQIGKTAALGEKNENMDEIRRHIYRSNELLTLTRRLIAEISTQQMEGYEIVERAS